LPAPKLGHRRALDGLRGVAILLVLFYHAYGHPSGGFYGVDVFFVLSGFLITTLLLEEVDVTARIDLGAFYRRRARRLLPALVVFLAVLAAGGLLRGRTGLVAAEVAAGLGYAMNVVRAAGSAQTLPLTGHLWSLAEEEQFYLVWPAVLIVLLRRRPRHLGAFLTACIALVVLYRAALLLAGTGHERLYFAPDTHADPILIGCLLAVIRRSGRAVVPTWLGIVAAGGLGVLAAGSEHFSTPSLLVGTTAAGLFAATVLAAGLTEGHVVERALSVAPLVWVGQISYSLYLWQQLVFKVSGENPPVTVVASIVVAAASYRFVERPFRSGRARAHDSPLLVPSG
jgi:peptidoglycan/LPS O-acetylase OafA/YrhL